MISERLRALKCFLVLLLVLLLLVEAGQGGLHVVRHRLRALLGLEGRRWGHLTNTVMIFLEDNGFISFQQGQTTSKLSICQRSMMASLELVNAI